MKKLITAIAFTVLILLGLVHPGTSDAMEKPTSQEIMQYKLEGTFQQRLNSAKLIGNNKADPYLVWRANNKFEKLFLEAQGKSEAEIQKELANNTPPPAWTGLPTTGTPKVIAILIDFPDYPHDTANQTVTDFKLKFVGSGDSTLYPYDSLTNFYKRSSYNQLTIGGNVLGWYRAAHNRSYYMGLGDGTGQDTLIKEALEYYNSSVNFAQYDNNSDGKIEGLYIKWTGPDNGWSNFWWAYQWYFHDTSYTIDGKHLGKYVWSWYSRVNGVYTGKYSPRTDIHETGHLLGLPDYYDYDDTVGPDGGVGYLDMMDSNWGDHNCFSKFVLDWITPAIIPSGTQTITLNPSGTSKDAALIMPSATNTPFQQCFMTQYRKRSVGNDPSNYPADGMLIWHIDATLNSGGSNYLYDNSYTAHKLLTLEQADGLGEIENGDGAADAGDYYLSPKTFTPSTNPNSNNYAGTVTNVLVDSLTAPGATMSARIGVSTGYSASGRVTTGYKSAFSSPEAVEPAVNQRRVNIETTRAESIALGQTISGTLTTSDYFLSNGTYYDVYSFTGKAGEQVAVSMNSTQFNTYLYLYDGLGYQLSDDNGGGGTNSRIPVTSGYVTLPHDGTFYIAANGYSATDLGSYTLKLNGADPLGGVKLTFAKVSGIGTVPAAVTTAADGSWAQSGFAAGTTYKVTPTKAGYSFTPTYRTFSAASTALNFTTVTPVVNSYSPADNASGIAVSTNLVLTFNQTVSAVSGKNIYIKKTADNTIVETIPVTDTTRVTLASNKVTINPTTTLTADTGYYVLISSGAFKNAGGGLYAGITTKTIWNFTTATATPLVNSYSPKDNATGIGVSSNLVLSFNQNVSAVSGKNIYIKKTADNTVVETIPVTDTTRVTVSGAKVTINPTSTLAANTGYYVLISSGAFKGVNGGLYAGITTKTIWNFTTATANPLVSSYSPADNATGVARTSNLVLTFNQTVSAVSGKNIYIKKTADNTIVETIPVTDTTRVTVSGGKVTINPTATLAANTGYYVLISSGAFKGVNGGLYAGITTKTIWNFTTSAS